MKSIKLLAAVAAVTVSSLASATVTAPAQINADVPSMVVQYSEMSLATATGVKSLHSRLRDAAKTVCAKLDSRVLALHEEYNRCVRNSMTRSVADVGNTNLSKFHDYGSLPRALAAN